jgi:16S rRNA (guanine527-N7)-methyltransferase
MNLPTLLQPYIEPLTATQLDQVATYLDLLLRWNARMNLTAIRDPEQIVTRHFGESFFLARTLTEQGFFQFPNSESTKSPIAVDVGSGAGFPGIPLKIARPEVTLMLVESQQRKAVFLREVLRAIRLDAEVNNVRAEDVARTQPHFADLVTFRAVEKFESILPVAAQLVRSGGYLALLIGSEQALTAQNLLKNWQFRPVFSIPGSQNRIIQLANQSS